MGSDSQDKSSPRRRQQHADLRLYETRLLPRLTWASLLGMALFFVYCGSALKSALPWGRRGGGGRP